MSHHSRFAKIDLKHFTEKILYRFIEFADSLSRPTHMFVSLPHITSRVASVSEEVTRLRSLSGERRPTDWMVFFRVCEMQSSASQDWLEEEGRHDAQLGPRPGLGRHNVPSRTDSWLLTKSSIQTKEGLHAFMLIRCHSTKINTFEHISG